MKLAVWLVDHTTEHTPGPWRAFAAGEGRATVHFVEAVNGDQAWCMLANLLPVHGFIGNPEPDAPAWAGNEAMANARLMADAPAMLRMIAVMLQGIQAALASSKLKPAAVQTVINEAAALIARHVRTGCAQVDAETHDSTAGPRADSHNREES